MRKQIVCVGCGGTGTYFLKEFSRYYSALPIEVKGYVGTAKSIIDGDRVEEKNLARQSFIEEDVGRGKATAFSEALRESFGVEWKSYPKFVLKGEDLPFVSGIGFPILIGCCDNHACRKIMEDWFMDKSVKDALYIDSANEYSDGQVVVALKKRGKILSPPRSYYFPDLFNGDMRNVEEMSCQELNESSPQHIATNMMAGNILLNIVCSAFEEKPFPTGIIFFNTERYSMECISASKYFSKGNESAHQNASLK